MISYTEIFVIRQNENLIVLNIFRKTNIIDKFSLQQVYHDTDDILVLLQQLDR